MSNRIQEFRTARGWSLQKLADAVGTSKSQIDKLEKGLRRLTVDWMVRLARPLGCDPRELMMPEPQERLMGNLAAGATIVSNMVPIRGLRLDRTTQNFLFTADAVDHVPRPYFLTHARDAYAFYMADESMAPMYRPRQLLFVNPHKPPSTGCGVVIIATGGAVRIREWVRATTDGIEVRTHQPQCHSDLIPADSLAAMHVIVGSTEP